MVRKRKYDFLKEVFETGIVSDEDVCRFMIFNYFLNGYSLDDFE